MQMYLCKLFDKRGFLEEKVFRVADSKQQVLDWVNGQETEGYWEVMQCEYSYPEQDKD